MRKIIPSFAEDFPTLVLLALMLLIAAGSLATANWADGLRLLFLIVLAGIGLGYLLAVSRFSDITAIFFSIAYGTFAVWLLGGALINAKGEMAWREQQVALLDRIGKWAQQAAGGGFSRDNVVFVVILALIFWFLTINAVLNIFRSHQLWIAAIPPGLALLINNYFYYGQAHMELFLIAYLLLVFTLAVRTNIQLREQLWRSARVGYSPGVRGDLIRGGVIGAIILLIVAWSAPAATASDQLASAWDRSINPWNRVQDTFNRLFNGLEGGTATTADYYGGATLSLGGPVALTDATVMVVYAPQGYRYYWRSKLFDYYDGRRWLTLSDAREDTDYGVMPEEEDANYALRVNVQQRFQMVIPATRLVYAAPQPVSFASLPLSYDVIYTLPPNKTYGTVTSVLGKNVISSGRTYTATSSLSLADETSLRGAGSDYPGWVSSRYLQLPAEITDRTKELAASVTAPYTDPYDKARAIESYLRKAIKYDVGIDPPPAGAEPVDYVLFTSKRGYCNYYASAMVIMLRSQGIPARVAAGFSQGEFDSQIKAFRVKELNAHTWVEAYFPRYGWIEFEPTTAISPIFRPETMQPGQPGQGAASAAGGPAATPTLDILGGGQGLRRDEQDQAAPSGLSAIQIPPVVWWGLGLAVVGALAVAGVWFWLEMRGQGSLSEISRSYARMNIFAGLAGLPVDETDTPYQRGKQIAEAVPKGRDFIQRIASLYAREQYAPPGVRPKPTDSSAEVARTDWLMLRPIMLRAALRRLLTIIRSRPY